MPVTECKVRTNSMLGASGHTNTADHEQTDYSMENSTPIPDWEEVRDALIAAIRDALPLQLKRIPGERVSGLGVHIDACYGSAGLYLLPESTAQTFNQAYQDNLGDWPISTDWDPSDDHSQAFARHWHVWDRHFYALAMTPMKVEDETPEDEDAPVDPIFFGLLRTACEAVQRIEHEGLLDNLPKTERF